MGTYEDKKAELVAVAQGGSAGRQAYQEGRARIVSDQRAALDAALAGPVQFGTGTAAALEGIIRPTQETGLARMDVASDRHGASMGALDAALSGALTQQGGARSLNYSETLRLGQQNTDRNMEMAEIARQKAAERAAAAAAAEEASYSQSEEKMAAEALGGLLHEDDLTALEKAQRQASMDDLWSVAQEAFSTLPAELQVALGSRMRENADDPQAIADLVATYSPAHAKKAKGIMGKLTDTLQSVGAGILNQGSARAGAPLNVPAPAPRVDPARTRAIDAALRGYVDGSSAREQELRALEAQRYAYNQNAYSHLFGDPLLAAGIFPESFDPVAESLAADRAIDEYIASGLTGKDYEDALAEQAGGFQTEIASAAGLTPGVVNSVAAKGDLDPIGVYEMLSDPEVAAVVSLAVETAVERYGEEPLDGAKRPARADITRDIVLDVTETLPDYVDSEYRQALAAIAREQFSYQFGG